VGPRHRHPGVQFPSCAGAPAWLYTCVLVCPHPSLPRSALKSTCMHFSPESCPQLAVMVASATQSPKPKLVSLQSPPSLPSQPVTMAGQLQSICPAHLSDSSHSSPTWHKGLSCLCPLACHPLPSDNHKDLPGHAPDLISLH
jgi:hypothetical protein